MISLIALLCVFAGFFAGIFWYRLLFTRSIRTENVMFKEHNANMRRVLAGKPRPMTIGLHTILKQSYGILLIANDFFAYATSADVLLSDLDLPWAVPFVEEHGIVGVQAIMAYIEGVEPIEPHRTKEFKMAMKALKELNPTVNSEAS